MTGSRLNQSDSKSFIGSFVPGALKTSSLFFDGKDSTVLLWVKTGAEATHPSLAATLSSKCRQQQKMILSCYNLYLDKFIKNVLVDDRTYEQDATRHWRFTGSAELDRMPRFYIYLNTWKMTDRSKWLQSILLWLTDWSKLVTQFSFAGESYLNGVSKRRRKCGCSKLGNFNYLLREG